MDLKQEHLIHFDQNIVLLRAPQNGDSAMVIVSIFAWVGPEDISLAERTFERAESLTKM